MKKIMPFIVVCVVLCIALFAYAKNDGEQFDNAYECYVLKYEKKDSANFVRKYANLTSREIRKYNDIVRDFKEENEIYSKDVKRAIKAWNRK